jgi:hypothetical protein
MSVGDESGADRGVPHALLNDLRVKTSSKRQLSVLSLSFGYAFAGGPGDGGNNGAIHGSDYDPSYPGLGEIEYLFNKPGYHFWFTPTENIGPYTAGHSYHNVYKYDVKDASDWCGPVNIPPRPPYNAGGTDGGTAYYKIWDVTAETWVCGSD